MTPHTITDRLIKGAIFIFIFLALLWVSKAWAGEVGTASWYSYESCVKEGTNGRITASGERFDHEAFTCASWFYKFGTTLRVTNLKNNRATLVRVTDRGPSKRLVSRGRIIDLSKGAFRQIASLKEGVIPVKVEVVQLAKGAR